MAEPYTESLANRLRYLINDIAAPQTFTDFQLRTYVAIAAVSVVSEVNTNIAWTIDTDIPSISPDPFSSAVNIGIPNLFVLKAACLVTQGELRKDVSKFGIKIRDHLTAYDGTEGMKARIAASKSFCELYEEVKWDWEIGNKAAGRAIVGPFTFADNANYSDRFALDWSSGPEDGRVQ
jgi:hypothetical protein